MDDLICSSNASIVPQVSPAVVELDLTGLDRKNVFSYDGNSGAF